MIEGLFTLVEILAVVVCIHNLYTKNKIFSIYTLVFLCLESVYLQLANRGIVSKQVMLVIYLLFILYTLLEFRDSLINSIYNCLVTMLIISVAQMIFYLPGVLVYNLCGSEDIMAILINALTLMLVIFTRKAKLYNTLHNICNRKEIKAIISIIISIGILIYYSYKIKKDNAVPLDLYLTCLLFLIIVIFSIYRWQRSNYEVELKEEQLKMARNYNDSFKILVDVVRKNQHDFDNHLLVLSGMNLNSTSQKELEEKQKDYKNTILEQNKYNKILYRINDSILAGYVFSKLVELEEQAIDVSYDVNVQSDKVDYIPVYIMIEIIGILLDNARDALEEVELNKRIKLVLNEDSEKFTIGVYNVSLYYSEESIIKFFKKGYSTKGVNRGIGLTKIKEYQKQYGFDILITNKIEDNVNWLRFNIVIKKATVS
ncbi:MAG: GHKL domain-containing protein [Eubacterium sp.]|nr:GHKL domain-containing protein [Eubacterium sp.]